MFNQSDELSQMFLLTFACVALTSPDSLTRVPLGVQRRAAERNELSLCNYTITMSLYIENPNIRTEILNNDLTN